MTAMLKYNLRVRIPGLLISLWLFIASDQGTDLEYLFPCINDQINFGDQILSLSPSSVKSNLQLKSNTDKTSGKRCDFNYDRRLFIISEDNDVNNSDMNMYCNDHSGTMQG